MFFVVLSNSDTIFLASAKAFSAVSASNSLFSVAAIAAADFFIAASAFAISFDFLLLLLFLFSLSLSRLT